jgi:citrate lyase subunit beta/citryl-CoA lyase
MRHPSEVLYAGEKALPLLPLVDHYAGSEKLWRKALALQVELGPVFDLTCDCEDGAPSGGEIAHAEAAAAIILSDDNHFNRVGARIHDVTHPCWRKEMDILVARAGTRLAYLTLPKVRNAADVEAQLEALRDAEVAHDANRRIPVHVLIETPGALREVWDIAALSGVESLDFGLMDFVSAHYGAIPANAMKSPGQFEHPLVARAKCEISAAALANGVIPSHNVCTELADTGLIRRDAERAAREFGYLRMWSIHPNQIVPILEALRPDFSEVAAAGEILVAAQDAQWGPIRYGGKLHDRASYRYYWQLLRQARAAAMPLPADIERRFFTSGAPDA